MPEHDDFDIIDEYGPEAQSARRRTGLWTMAILAFIVLAFGIGLAFSTIRDRFGNDDSPAQIDVAPAPPQNDAEPATQATAPPTAESAAEVAAATTATPTLTPEATATSIPTCAIAAAPEFAQYAESSLLGCALTPEVNIVWSAWESFERGGMLWRKDTDRAYLFTTNGLWSGIDEKWEGKPIPDRGAPPPGLQAPVRGFGFVWGVRDDIYQQLGWATDQERGFCAAIQDFEQGFILQSSPVGSCTADNLYNHAAGNDWSPLLIVAMQGGRWHNGGGGTAQLPPILPANANSPSTSASGDTRPAEHGIFYAARAQQLSFDGNFNDWPNNWSPLQHVVYGAESYSGGSDLAASFQAMWTESELLLAIRIADERYRPGPFGTDMWQGDGLELHLDRLLAADYAESTVSDDDYQIGLGFDDALQQVRGFHWLPFAKAGSLNPSGRVVATADGYHAEMLIPWTVFDLQGQVQQGRAYGFNLSVNDNDADAHAQETVLSASPRRTTHDNPTEWATLILAP